MIAWLFVALFTLLCVISLAIGGWFATDMFRMTDDTLPEIGKFNDYSAFISLTITVNSALVVHRVRGWLFRRLRKICDRRFIKAQGNGLMSLSEETSKTVYGYADILQYVFQRRLNIIALIAIVGSPICAFAGTFLLVAGIPRTPQWFVRCIPCLLLPACAYYSATLSCYLWMIDHYYQICQGYVLYARTPKSDTKCMEQEGGGFANDGFDRDDEMLVRNFYRDIQGKIKQQNSSDAAQVVKPKDVHGNNG